jgi:hypothetical protein
MGFVAMAGLPIPTPSYCFLTSPESDEWADGGVEGVLADVGEPFEEPEDPSSSAVLVSIETVGSGDDTTALKRSGCGRVLAVGDISSMEGEPLLTLVLRGGVAEAERNTELLVVALPLRQETAASDLEGAGMLKVVAVGVPRDVPPLITVVRLGVGVAGPAVELTGTNMPDSSSWSPKRLVMNELACGFNMREANLPPMAAVIGTGPRSSPAARAERCSAC